MKKKSFINALKKYLDDSPMAYHAANNSAAILKEHGFIELCEAESWKLKEGKKYFVKRNEASIIAFVYHSKEEGMVMMGAHTDSPHLRLKPNPYLKKASLHQFKVEVYGGVLLSTWYDRELSLAGRVGYSNKKGELKQCLINLKEPIALIPSLAIHLNPEANEGVQIKTHDELNPIVNVKEPFAFEPWLLQEVKNHDSDAERILSHELGLYDVQKAHDMDATLLCSARLDNLLSCFVGTMALTQANTNALMVLNDHEEVGSGSAEGASGPFLSDVLKRIYGEHYFQALSQSFMVSCDNAHAKHPNFMSKYDDENAPELGGGVAIKMNANQRYASNTQSIARFKKYALETGVEVQEFANRNDLRCGTTIGPITAAKLGISTVDVGIPQFAMHSIRESAHCDDIYALYKILSTMMAHG